MNETKTAGDYFEHQRDDLIALVPQGDNKILDIGAASGKMGHTLKQTGKAIKVIGVELNEKAADIARERLDMIICGNIEQIDLPFEEGYFDYIILGDILEHLIDPWGLLKKLKKYLSNDGQIIASLPNVRHWSIIKDLVFKGSWEYQSEGILDKTHLRFFTRRNIYHLFDSSGYRIQTMKPSWSVKMKVANVLSLGLFKDFLTYQFLLMASKKQ